MSKDIEVYAKDRLAELMHGKTETIQDLRSEVEDAEEDYDGDSYAPYYNQKEEIIRDYEREFGSDAEDICGEATFKASEYMQAMSAYADAIGYTAFQHYFAEAKTDFSDALGEIEQQLSERGLDADEYKIGVHSYDPYGWSAHNREEDTPYGTLCFHESRQLDGLNGVSMRVWDGLWLAVSWEPNTSALQDAGTGATRG